MDRPAASARLLLVALGLALLPGVALAPLVAASTAGSRLPSPVRQVQPEPAPAPQPPAVEPFVPDEAFLGVPLYPSAQFITSYNAGFGQRYYLFGVKASFDSMVSYYRTVLKSRGDLVYDAPPVHMFETGRFREDAMAFPPSVTIKDYTWGGSEGYLVPQPGGQWLRYPTIIQIVPVSPAERR